ncbi:TPA: restriction endonuclease subunit S [Legionella pneumophila]
MIDQKLWLKNIPDDWSIEKLIWHFGAEKGIEAAKYTKEYCGLNPGKYPVYSGQTSNDGVMGLIATYDYDAGSQGVLFSTTVGANAMYLRHIKGKFSLSQNCMIIKPRNNKLDIRYAHYHLIPLFRYERELIPEHMQASFRVEDLSRYYIAIPPFHTQQEIADFLDRETDRINQLIEKKQKLIEVLQEKQANLINHAVRQGINPNLTMKRIHFPGIELIPECWEVKKLRHLGSLQNGVSEGAEYFGEGYPFVGYGDVYNHFALPTNVSGLAKSSDIDRKRYSVLAGDVFFTRTSEVAEEIGISSACLETIDNATFSGFLIRFRPNGKTLLPNFSKYYFRSDIPRIFFVKEMNLVTRVSLSQGLLKSLPVIIPPIEEQEEISHFLDMKTAQINVLSKNVEHSINQLKEFRISLITEAVTGQLDIASWKKRGSTDERLDNIEEAMRA